MSTNRLQQREKTVEENKTDLNIRECNQIDILN